ncbi:DNA-binding response OmpR family regulator [Sphingobacterium allocomposti]|uniref:DNA-binding response OmpR family regulator n=1 Tax=Sphingobacterium allocomposti TaxID=415956 RepID=A0A5S5DKK3_9SPHI|nr:response regulator transcription factor [Sphingobacterium composti Yoo et al. 2007 non Ten et al. 2007]TYP95686.1 DNA-binding response OmpR family regulator [Sphingobacterium composti Yoo et al. 2007 non Ten et al. 2007]
MEIDKHLLYVEDENDLGNVVTQYLEMVGFQVSWRRTATDALDCFSKTGAFDLILIDVQLPDFNGFELARRIKEQHADQPFLFLTARGEKNDRIEGLHIGADDYITKPFDIDELVLRIRNILRRRVSHRAAVADKAISIARIGDIELDAELHKLYISGRSFDLTSRETQLILYLAKNEGKLLRREEILLTIWGENDYFMGRSLDVFISRIRKLLKHSSKLSIETVYGAGFIFRSA